MKPPTVFLGEMTNREVEAFVADHRTVFVPVGSTEQHGPHGPLATDTLVPTEVARRVAAKVGAAVAPSIGYGLSYPHAGFTGVVYLRIPTFMSLVEDVAVGLATMGFRTIVFLNGHYDNTLAIAYACANAADRLAEGTRAFPINYWDGLTADEAAEFFGPTAGLHANRAETSAVMAIDEALVDLEHANAEMPPLPEVGSPAAVHTAFFFSTPGSVYRATHSGTWGDAREASVEFGQRYLDVAEAATLRMLEDVERTYAAMPPR
jgi:creatinine amidohydrolase